jgi:hypothetical protein
MIADKMLCTNRGLFIWRRVMRPGGTNKRSVYMESSYSAFVSWLPHDAEMSENASTDLSDVYTDKK